MSPPPDHLALHRTMLLIRAFEEQVRRLAAAGQVPGLVHLCTGQEAVAAGAIGALRRDDLIASHHRGHGHCLAKGAPPGLLMAEILGRAPGLSGGRGGSMHVFDAANGNLGTNGIVGGGVPLACGAALSAKTRGSGQVALAFFGDGALNQGLVGECMNMAMVWTLPVVFVCEHNGYGEFTASADVTAGSLAARGAVFGMPTQEVDGMDALAVHDAVATAAARARAGQGPSFLVCHTWRFGGHHAGDSQDYKDDAETRRWRARDPIPRLAAALRESGLADDAALAAMEAEAARLATEAAAFARAAPEPAPDALHRHIFA